jgi:3-phenylpropionate/trans-cinnamate dioxygenase ferredoxin reductase component
MSEKKFHYVIVGAGLAGVSAIEGIRNVDRNGSILLVGNEKDMPYDRPPLSKKLWFGKKKIDEIFLHDAAFYESNRVQLKLGVDVTDVDSSRKVVKTNENGPHGADSIEYSKLLLATGGQPRKLQIPGGDLEDICYFRTMDDYKKIRNLAVPGKKALIIGGGFIGSELAAALNSSGIEVTMIFPEHYLVQRIFPENLGRVIQTHYLNKGVNVLCEDVPVAFEKQSGQIKVTTRNGLALTADIVIAGVGIAPSVHLAEKAGLAVENGILVNDVLQTSNKDIYSAGDNTNFKSLPLNRRMRVEHWDNSIAQGKAAGSNMAELKAPFDYVPYFFSDLFEFGFEAVGDINSQLQTIMDWKKEFDTGVVYYLENDIVNGIMLCNVWDKVDAAREIIRSREKIKPESLRGALRF